MTSTEKAYDRIYVQDVPLSIRQYQWLFDDLQSRTAGECYNDRARYGAGEATSSRHADPYKLSAIQVQKLSDFPLELPSQCVKLDIGSDYKSLDIRFAHCNIPVGHFAFSHIGSGNTHSILSLNSGSNDWYQRGLPGISTSIQSTAKFLKNVINSLGCTYVRTIGSSMGAYAAILFGYLLDADQIIACDPEIRLGDTLMRSWMWNPLRYYDPEYFDVSKAIMKAGRRATISVSVYDPMEATTALTLLQKGASPIFSKFFHGSPGHLDWRTILARPRDTPSSYVNSSLTVDPPDQSVLVASARLYRDSCLAIAKPGARQYSAARDSFPSIALYDAILSCVSGSFTDAASYMRRYVRFKRSLKCESPAEPLFDVQRRFNISALRSCQDIQNFLIPFMPPSHHPMSVACILAWMKYFKLNYLDI